MRQNTFSLSIKNSHSSLRKFCKLQKKISDFIQQQSTTEVNSEAESTKLSAQKIPKKFIVPNKFISSQKNLTNNKKFDWINKIMKSSNQSNSSSKIPSEKASLRQSFSNLKKIRCKTDTVITKVNTFLNENEFLSGWNERSKNSDSFSENFKNFFPKQSRPETPKKGQILNQDNSFELLKQIQVNKKMLIKSQSYELKSFQTIPDKENPSSSKENKQNFQKVLSMENRKKSFIKRKRILQSENKIERSLQEKQNSSKFLLSGFNPKDSIEEFRLSYILCDQQTKNKEAGSGKTKKCIKNLKKEYICLSRQSRKMQSQFLKRSKNREEQIRVQPWNFTNQENDQVQGVIRFY